MNKSNILSLLKRVENHFDALSEDGYITPYGIQLWKDVSATIKEIEHVPNPVLTLVDP